MAIKKVKGLESGFSILPNGTINAPLSWAAKGLLAYLLSKPDDWEVSVAQLINHSSESLRPTKRDGTYVIINELIETGYIRRVRTSGGGYSKTEYTVSSEPLTEKPEQDKPHPDKPTQQSKVSKQSKDTNKTNVSPKGNTFVYPEEFEWIWNHKPEREGGNPKRKAYSACNARIKQGATWRELAEGLNRYREYCLVKKIINTSTVQMMSTFFGTGEGFKESWEVKTNEYNQTNKQKIHANGGKQSAVDRNNERLLNQYGSSATRNTRRGAGTSDHRMDSHEVSRGVRGQMASQGITLDMDARNFGDEC